MAEQIILRPDNGYEQLTEYLDGIGAKKIMTVLDGSVKYLEIYPFLKNLKIDTVSFTDFKPNPDYESVKKGVELFKSEGCDCVIAVGGGSCMDVAKCIKLFAVTDESENPIEQPLMASEIPFIAMPTTAGSGSEATRYAVIYLNGEKQSITQESCIPNAVILDPSVLTTLPDYQKKSGMLDALCHGIESLWSVNSTDESKGYSRKAIRLVIENYKSYLSGDEAVAGKMLEAANTAGKAINITQTTAGHAMCYKLTTLYGIAHGHAAALCVEKLLDFTAKNIDKCIDGRGQKHLEKTLVEIAEAMGCKTIEQAAERFAELLKELELTAPTVKNTSDFDLLKKSVNPIRLKNNPIALTEAEIDSIYHEILTAFWGSTPNPA